jgi:hypothetical protein
VRNTIAFVSIRKSIVENASFQAANLEAVGKSEAVGAALDHAAGIAHRLLQNEVALGV